MKFILIEEDRGEEGECILSTREFGNAVDLLARLMDEHYTGSEAPCRFFAVVNCNPETQAAIVDELRNKIVPVLED